MSSTPERSEKRSLQEIFDHLPWSKQAPPIIGGVPTTQLIATGGHHQQEPNHRSNFCVRTQTDDRNLCG